MRKNLLLLPVLLVRSGTVKNLKKFLFLAFAFLLAVQLNAQQLQPQALAQIKFLMQEKASRTAAQKKVDSHILLAFKMKSDAAFAKALPDFQTGVKTDNNGKVKVDIDATVTPQLISDLKTIGADIIFSSQKFNNIVANVPLNKVETIADLKDIKHINQWMAPTHNDPRNNEPSIAGNNFISDNNKVDFATRATNVRNELKNVLGPKEFAGSGNFVGAVTSEADKTHKADLARTVFGATGAGVKIGVLSDGVDGYANSQASGDLPSVITILSGQAGSGSEGRAMMELIHDIAPDADLYFATAFNGQASFAQNILDLRAAGCDIIVDDVTYYAEGVFQDDNVAQSVNAVTADGAMYFSSAGNSGNKNDGTAGVWEGDFVDGGSVAFASGGTVNDFGSGVVYDAVTATTGLVTLKWSDPLGQSGNDYDLYATNSAGTSVYAGSNTIQDGNDNPYEYLPYNFPAGYRIYIFKKTGAAVRALHLNTNRGRLTISTPGVMYGHNAGANTYTVAATPAAAPYYSNFPQGPYPDPFNSSNVVEGFSSDGPRKIFYNPDGTAITPGNILFSTNGGTTLSKPDFTAADGCVTNTPGFSPFYGTSAASPNAAAIAGLVKSKFPSMTRSQIYAALVASAIDIETPGVDRDAGNGIVMAYEALEAAGGSAAYIQAGSPVTITAENGVPPNNAPDPGETLTVELPLVNVGNTATDNLVATLLATGGVTSPSSPQSYGAIAGGGSTVQKPFTFTAMGTCGDNITLTLALQDGATDMGTVTYTLKMGTTQLNSPATFSNTTAITVPTVASPATPYPSTIDVTGLTGKIAKITIGLNQLNHTWPGDLDLLLVSPTGKKMIIMSDVMEAANSATNINLVLDDAATSLMPSGAGLVSGTYKPTNYGASDAFVSPAPAAPYENPAPGGTATLNGVFGGDDANGTWSLYVVDDANLDGGSFSGGWSLTITTGADVCAEIPPSGPTISIADKSITEGNNGNKIMWFNVTLSEKPTTAVTVHYAAKAGTATPGEDYSSIPALLIFPANSITTLKIPVLIKGDLMPEPDETFTMMLSKPVGATIANGVATGTIINDDGGDAIAKSGSGDAASAVMLANSAVKISPNPAISTTNVSLNGFSGKVTILVTDMKGKVLQEKKVQVQSAKPGLQTINVSKYAAGNYLVTIVDEKGNRRTETLVIAR